MHNSQMTNLLSFSAGFIYLFILFIYIHTQLNSGEADVLIATRDIHIHKALLALLSLCDFYSVVSGYLQTANKTWYSKQGRVHVVARGGTGPP